MQKHGHQIRTPTRRTDSSSRSVSNTLKTVSTVSVGEGIARRNSSGSNINNTKLLPSLPKHHYHRPQFSQHYKNQASTRAMESQISAAASAAAAAKFTLASLANAGGMMRKIDLAQEKKSDPTILSGGSTHDSVLQSLHSIGGGGVVSTTPGSSSIGKGTGAAAADAAAAVTTNELTAALNGGYAAALTALQNGGNSRSPAASPTSPASATTAASLPNSGGKSSSSKKCSLPNSSHSNAWQSDGKPFNTGRWSDEEHNRFLEGLAQYGTGNWKKITEMVGTRSCTQIRTHAQKYFIALQKPASTGTERGRKAGSAGSLSRKSGSSKMLTGGVTTTGFYGVTELHQAPLGQFSSPRSGNGISKRRKLRLTKGAASASPKLKGGVALTGIEALARAAEAESQDNSVDSNYESLDDAADDYRSGDDDDDDDLDDERKRARHLDANDQPPYEDEADEDSPSQSKRARTVRGHHPSPPPSGRSVKRTSSMIGAAASIASLANANVVSSGNALSPAVSTKPDAAVSAAQLQELDRLRQEVSVANDTALKLQQQNRELEIRLLTTIEEKNRVVTEFTALQEVNTQITAEHHRALMMLEQAQAQQQGASSGMTTQQAAEMEAALAANPEIIAAAAANNISPHDLARLHRQQHEQQLKNQNQQSVELLKSQLTEAELRFHQVTESLTRQTQVLTDQHRAILELTEKFNKERSARQALENELAKLKSETSSAAATAVVDNGSAPPPSETAPAPKAEATPTAESAESSVAATTGADDSAVETEAVKSEG